MEKLKWKDFETNFYLKVKGSESLSETKMDVKSQYDTTRELEMNRISDILWTFTCVGMIPL